MRKDVLVILIILSFHSVQSQILKGIVSDSISKEKLAYANLILDGKNIGTYSNEDGRYYLNLLKTNIQDTLIVSLIGYDHKKIALSQFIDSVTPTYNFQLVPKTELLDEILIVSKTKNYSNSQEKLATGNRKTTFPSSSTFSKEIVTLIENPKGKSGKLIDLQLTFKNRNNKDYKTYPTYFRLYFYRVNASGFPGKLINFENIIIKPKKDDKTFKIHLEDKHILFDKTGFFVGIETVKPDDINVEASMYLTTPNIVYTHTNKLLVYSRFVSEKWKTNYRKSIFRKNLYAVPFIKVTVVYKDN
ncbi:MAG: carboxypeptidase-like regulatory domain-containing protein [Winogradskyella sp.]|uniref:carboxypeptidase-like regulatory domain-containing protein n=1 Tax=Winogradskyella sp. TaxID=1883156 RepID=UPI00385EFA39